MLNLANEWNKSLQSLLRDKAKVLDYMKVTAQRMWIDINKYKWTNEYKTKTIDSPLLPLDFPLLIYKLLDIIELYITVRKYSQEIITPTKEEVELFTTITDIISTKDLDSKWEQCDKQ